MSESLSIKGVSVDAYVTDITGTVTQFIRATGLTAADVVLLDARETAAALVAGYQTVDVGGAVVGGDATGLANDATAYTATITVDGVDKAISVVGSAAQTYTDLLTEIGTDLGATATIEISGGDLLVTSATTDNDSKVVITDVDLFATLTTFVALGSSVDGNLETDLMGQTHTGTGRNAWTVYSGLVETYDSASDDVVRPLNKCVDL